MTDQYRTLEVTSLSNCCGEPVSMGVYERLKLFKILGGRMVAHKRFNRAFEISRPHNLDLDVKFVEQLLHELRDEHKSVQLEVGFRRGEHVIG